MSAPTVEAQFERMRKPAPFRVLPRRPGEPVVVHAGRYIGSFHPRTGHGVFNGEGSNRKVTAHLMTCVGARPFRFPRKFVRECMKALREYA